MELLTGRLKREHQTLVCMTGIYCEDHHDKPGSELCDSCAELMKYAETRLAKCPYGQAKPTCAKCPIHCYKKQQREQVREVMRYAGPRMARRHPWRALVHIFDKLRRAVHPMELRRARSRKP
jgi:hypothetical protein